MPEPKEAQKFGNLTTSDVAELLGVTPRQVRNWANDKVCPQKTMAGAVFSIGRKP